MKERISEGGAYQRVLSDFGGLDVSENPSGVAYNRFTRMDNMWRDYRAGDGTAVETFPGFRILCRLAGAVHAIGYWRCSGEEYLTVHAGTSLYVRKFSDTDGTALTDDWQPVAGGNGCLRDGASRLFQWEEDMYLLDGEGYYTLRRRDGVMTLSAVNDVYTPLTYADGEPYEQRNLLSRYATNRYHIGMPSEYAPATAGLLYYITDENAGECEVCGVEKPFVETTVYIPARTVIAGREYRVTRIGWKALITQLSVREVFIGDGVTDIGIAAFYNCINLQAVYLPDSVKRIGRGAFYGCPLQTVCAGTYLNEIEEGAFPKAGAPATIRYHGTQTTYGAVTVGENNGPWQAATVTYHEVYPLTACYFPFCDRMSAADLVTLDGTAIWETGEVYYETVPGDGNTVAGILIKCTEQYCLTGRTLEITGTLAGAAGKQIDGKTDFAAANPGYGGRTDAAMARCRIAAVYDGRIFYTGNPDLPNTVFYSARDRGGHINPAYIGSYNYFQCGVDGTPNTALLPTAACLAVLKGDTPPGGIYYYAGQDTGDGYLPRIYTLCDSVGGCGCAGVAAGFADDPVFLSRSGLGAAGKQALNAERSIRHRSTTVDAALAAHDPGSALAAVWEGYLILLYPDGEAYMADSRRTYRGRGDTEYEWYHLSGIGTYTDDLTVYRYADGTDGTPMPRLTVAGTVVETSLHPCPGALPFGVDEEGYPARYAAILSGTDTEGNAINYTAEETDGHTHYYLLTATEERVGGTFSPPCAMAECGGKLLFGCADGSLCVVNTDRRGIRNEAQRAALESGEKDVLSVGEINPEWYSYGGHRIRCGVETAQDDCGIANYTKRTLRQTTTAEMKTAPGSGCRFLIRISHGAFLTQTEEYPLSLGPLDFSGMDYGRLVFGTGDGNAVPLRERTGRWLRKQYCIYSDTFAQPFGLYRICYSYRAEGRMKVR